MVARKNGRPLKVEITETHLKQISTLGGYGLSVAQIAEFIGVSRSVFYDYMRRDPAIRSAYNKGRAIAAARVSKSLFEKACAGDMRAVQWYESTRLGINPNNPIQEETFDEGADLSLLEDDELETLARIMKKASPGGEFFEGDYEEMEDDEATND